MRTFEEHARERVPEAAAVALALILGLTIWLGTRYVSQVDWVRHTLEVQTKLSDIWSLVQDAEIGQRSFVLTGDERFLAPYKNASQQLTGELDKLNTLTIDNPRQVAAIVEARPLIAQRLSVARQTIELRRTGEFDRARNQVLEGRGLALMQDLRVRFDRMKLNEDELLEARLQAARTTIRILIAALLLGAIGSSAPSAPGSSTHDDQLLHSRSPIQLWRATLPSAKPLSCRCGRCRKWMRSVSSPAALRMISTICWPSSSAVCPWRRSASRKARAEPRGC